MSQPNIFFLTIDSLRADKIHGSVNTSSTPNVEKVGTLTREQIEGIAKQKMPDLNCYNIEAAVKSVAGTANSMGVLTKET